MPLYNCMQRTRVRSIIAIRDTIMTEKTKKLASLARSRRVTLELVTNVRFIRNSEFYMRIRACVHLYCLEEDLNMPCLTPASHPRGFAYRSSHWIKNRHSAGLSEAKMKRSCKVTRTERKKGISFWTSRLTFWRPQLDDRNQLTKYRPAVLMEHVVVCLWH